MHLECYLKMVVFVCYKGRGWLPIQVSIATVKLLPHVSLLVGLVGLTTVHVVHRRTPLDEIITCLYATNVGDTTLGGCIQVVEAVGLHDSANLSVTQRNQSFASQGSSVWRVCKLPR